mmetsp:Transcript_45962/g.115250  ORF Transcript_45962/g.115250 Transcript_45962/m.115250 type:complete len:289 (-) Transcript_45962:277-1143(-)
MFFSSPVGSSFLNSLTSSSATSLYVVTILASTWRHTRRLNSRSPFSFLFLSADDGTALGAAPTRPRDLLPPLPLLAAEGGGDSSSSSESGVRGACMSLLEGTLLGFESTFRLKVALRMACSSSWRLLWGDTGGGEATPLDGVLYAESRPRSGLSKPDMLRPRGGEPPSVSTRSRTGVSHLLPPFWEKFIDEVRIRLDGDASRSGRWDLAYAFSIGELCALFCSARSDDATLAWLACARFWMVGCTRSRLRLVTTGSRLSSWYSHWNELARPELEASFMSSLNPSSMSE